MFSVSMFGATPKKPIVQPFETTNVCRVVRGEYIFIGHDGKQGKSRVSCTIAFTEWVYVK